MQPHEKPWEVRPQQIPCLHAIRPMHLKVRSTMISSAHECYWCLMLKAHMCSHRCRCRRFGVRGTAWHGHAVGRPNRSRSPGAGSFRWPGPCGILAPHHGLCEVLLRPHRGCCWYHRHAAGSLCPPAAGKSVAKVISYWAVSIQRHLARDWSNRSIATCPLEHHRQIPVLMKHEKIL